MANSPNDPSAAAPKLHIDSDWKAQAQAEKERLAQREAELESKRAANPEEFPPADFKGLVGVLVSQALMGLGAYGDEQGRVIIDLPGSRFAIDLLGVLEEKTKGNLSKEEAEDLTNVLSQLRARFMQLATMVQQQMAARAAGGAGGGAGGASAGLGGGIAGRIDPLSGSGGGSGGGGGKKPTIEIP
jgi:hypothetical protein